MAEDLVVAVVRHREAVLLCRGSGPGPALPRAAIDDDPTAALDTLLTVLGVEPYQAERWGAPFKADGAVHHPVLVTAETRPAVDPERCPDPTWDAPTVLLRQSENRWWRAYAAVAPTVESVAGDAERGSTAIAIDALWALRDAAGRADGSGEGLASVESTAVELLEARPSMAALANRVNRVVADADTPSAVEAAATGGLVRAHEADAAAARLAAETVDGGRVLTLSRSGTVRAALLDARPAVVVLASRPGGEGRAVAEELAAAGLTVETAADAAVYDRLAAGDVDPVLVGADAVTPDGGVVNKVGTRAAALAADRASVPCYAVCASDKVQPASAAADDTGSDVVAIDTPTDQWVFDWTPPGLVTAVLTERGRLAAADVAAVAEEHRELAR